jgi:hypothetical protein
LAAADSPGDQRGGEHEPDPVRRGRHGQGVPVGPEENQTFQLRARYADQSEHTINVLGDLWASYVPFGADGDRATNTFEG